MVKTPSYPKDAAVSPRGGGVAETPAVEAEAAAKAETPRVEKPKVERPVKAKAADKNEAQPDSKRTKHLVAGAAIGIGSAALVAALLYANRNKRG